MKDTFEFTLNNPLTEEQWDMISDVDFDRTDRISFHTKHGKEVEFTKVIRCKDCKHYDKFIRQNIGQGWCDIAAWRGRYMWNDDYCSRAERKGEDAKRKS